MEPKNLVMSVIVGMIALTGVLIWTESLNVAYNEDLGSEFSPQLETIQAGFRTEILSMSTVLANNTQSESGANIGTQDESVLSKSRSTFSTITGLLGIIPTAIPTFFSLIGLQGTYLDLAVAAFWIGLSITLAYILILGVRRLTP
jgi:hypothetical protein